MRNTTQAWDYQDVSLQLPYANIPIIHPAVVFWATVPPLPSALHPQKAMCSHFHTYVSTQSLNKSPQPHISLIYCFNLGMNSVQWRGKQETTTPNLQFRVPCHFVILSSQGRKKKVVCCGNHSLYQ